MANRPENVPEGYTFKRCDQYSAEELIECFGTGRMQELAREYISAHPKEVYDTDDEIAIKQMLNPVGCNGDRWTSKHYYNPADARLELHPNDMNRRDPTREINKNYRAIDYRKARWQSEREAEKNEQE